MLYRWCFFMSADLIQKNTDALEQIVEMSLLFDFYGNLLKEHKRAVFEDYICNDYSLSEIATQQGISRQGVHNIVKSCSKELAHYEATLHLIEKFHNTKEHVNQIHEIAKHIRKTRNIDDIEQIEVLSNQILDML